MNDPFGLPESAADRIMREERKRTDFYRRFVGDRAVAEAIREATKQQKLFRDLDYDRQVRTVLETLKRDRASREAFTAMASTAWAQSISETARNIAQQSAGLIEEQRRLSSSVLDTVRAFDVNRRAVASAMVALKGDRDFRQTIAGTLSELSTYGAIAEQMRLLDVMTLHASKGIARSATAVAAEMVLETQRIAEAIATASTEEDGAALVGELFEKLLGYLISLGPKTMNEIASMGLVGWTGWFFSLAGLVLSAMARQPNQTPEQQATVSELSQKVETLQEERRRYHEAETRADEAYVSNLPRAELARDATFRREPERSGKVVLDAPKGMVLAIEKSDGRWRRVVFRDPLSHQLSRAWVYVTAVTKLADPLDEASE